MTEPDLATTDGADGSAPGSRASRRYVGFLLLAFLLPLAAVVAVNLGVDPFLYRWPRAASAPEPAYGLFDREVHDNLVAHAKPRALLLGNSQTQHGLVPAHWRTDGPVINAAMVGADLPEIARALGIAQANGRVEEAILGLDYSMSIARGSGGPSTHEGYVVAPDGRPRVELARSLLSFTMLRASLVSLSNRQHHRRFFGSQGEALDLTYRHSVIVHGGAVGTMAGRLAQFEKSLPNGSNDFDAQLRDLRDAACRGGTRLHVFLTPIHVVWAEALAEAGREPAWERWKRDIVAISSEKPGCGFDVWDFNTYNPVTTEPVPTGNAGFVHSWDGVHFKPEVGDRILARMAEAPSAGGEDGFGVPLTPATIDAALTRNRAAAAAYRIAHPEAPGPADILRGHAARSA